VEDNWWEGFYKRSLLWGLAWIPVLTMWLSVAIFKPSIRVGGLVFTWDEARRMTEAVGDIGQKKFSIANVGMHLCSFGPQYSIRMEDGFGAILSSFQGNLIAGLLALLIGLLIIGLATKDSKDCFYAVGPFLVYSLAAIFWTVVWIAPHNSSYLTNADSIIAQVVIYSLLAGFVAKMLLMSAHNSGLVELTEGADFSSLSNRPRGVSRDVAQLRIDHVVLPNSLIRSKSSTVLAGSESQPVQPSSFHEDDAVPLTTMAEEVHQIVKSVVVSLVLMVAYYCPFCGGAMKRFARPFGVKPWICRNRVCGSNLAPFKESEEKLCSNCKGCLLDASSAVYCHHCGWKIGNELPTLPGGGQNVGI